MFLELLIMPLTGYLFRVHRDGAGTLAEQWRLFSYMAKFEALRIPQDPVSFRSCSKAALVRGLWRDYRQNSTVVRLVADIMLDYHVNDATLWLAVLRTLLTFGRFRDLLALLKSLCSSEWQHMLRFEKKFATLFEQARSTVFVSRQVRAGSTNVWSMTVISFGGCVRNRCYCDHSQSYQRVAATRLRSQACLRCSMTSLTSSSAVPSCN